jgi:hypothetical protein
MLYTHDAKHPKIHPTSRIAPNAIVCGDVTIGANCSVGFGAVLTAESSLLPPRNTKAVGSLRRRGVLFIVIGKARCQGCLSNFDMQFPLWHHSAFLVCSLSSPKPRGPLARSTSRISSR